MKRQSLLGVCGLLCAWAFVGCSEPDDASTHNEDDLLPDGDTLSTYGSEMDYPSAPHGFISSVIASGQDYEWVGGGDAIPNICLPNQDDTIRCLGEFWQDDVADILFVDFSAVWCPICRNLAEDEPTIVAKLAERGWNAEWITVIYENASFERPTLADAAAWESQYQSTGDVLYDNAWTWRDAPWLDTRPEETRSGQPLLFVVDTREMEIWYAFSGYSPAWATDAGADWFVANFEEYSDY